MPAFSTLLCPQPGKKSVADAVPVLINDGFAVLFGKRALLRVRQYVQNHFGGTAQLRAERCHYHRAINEDRMSQHGIEQFVIAEAVFCQAELFVRFGIFAQQGSVPAEGEMTP